MHLFVAYAHRLCCQQDEPAVLCVISATTNLRRLVENYQACSDQGYTEVIFLKSMSSPLKEYLRGKNSLFSKIRDIVTSVRPDRIYTGNDRRIEFQYAATLVKNTSLCKTAYLDEGIYTYISRGQSHKKFQNKCRALIKKAQYGSWWEDTNQLGESTHIDEKIVFFPCLLSPENKEITPFPVSVFQQPEFRHMCHRLLNSFQLNPDEMEEIDVIYTLPFENLLLTNKDYLISVRKILDSLPQHCQLALKNHPRNKRSVNALLETSHTFTEIPCHIPFEFTLPFLSHCYILGDASSTLMMSRLIRPEITVISLSPDLAKDYDSIADLFRSVGIADPQSLSTLVAK
jgi:hypothetical protein